MGAALVAVYLAHSRRVLNQAQGIEALTSAAVALINPLREEIVDLQKKLAAADRHSEHQDRAIANLQKDHRECLEREAGLRAELRQMRANHG